MNINTPPGRIVPQDHVEWLISRYGFRHILLAVLTHSLRRNRLRLRRSPQPRGKPPRSDYLRRDIGLPPEPAARNYWELR